MGRRFIFAGAQVRRLISVLLIVYLTILFLGPATNPVATPDLTGPMRQQLSPVYQALYMGHGYRFFAPNPGPSHIITYEIGLGDGESITGQLPDREAHWPRLLYHRWFMLSETLFMELNGMPDESSFEQSQKVLDSQVEQLQKAGKLKYAARIRKDKADQLASYEQGRKRIKGLVDAIAQYLIRENNGKWIKLSVRERAIPFPGEVIMGKKLDDSLSLSEPLKSWVVEAKQ